MSLELQSIKETRILQLERQRQRYRAHMREREQNRFTTTYPIPTTNFDINFRDFRFECSKKHVYFGVPFRQ